eukprot:scaffold211_cov83-Skeletonema_dohrnii-CCMP3373.AAC.5
MAAEGDHIIRFNYNYTGAGDEVPDDATHVTIAKSVTVIRRDAFHGNHDIVEVICDENVKKVEEEAFACFSCLRRVVMLGVEVVEYRAFDSCEALTHVECGKLEIIKFQAFGNCTSLGSIDLPSARIVEGNAFNYCEALTDVKFGSKLERIEDGVFCFCPSLERITIPLKDGILAAAISFIGCDNLKHVDLVEGAVHETIAALPLEEWRNDMNEEVDTINQILPKVDAGDYDDDGEKSRAIRTWIRSVLHKIIHYQAEHQRYLNEEIATTPQLALPQDIVMNNVLPFLELPLYKFELEDEEEKEEGDDDDGRRDVTIWRRCFICLANFLMKHV